MVSGIGSVGVGMGDGAGKSLDGVLVGLGLERFKTTIPPVSSL